MTISLTPDLEKLVDEKVASGRYASAIEVIRESLQLLQERDDFHRFGQEALRREVEVGFRQIENGQTRTFSPDDLKRRVRERLGGLAARDLPPLFGGESAEAE